MSNTPSIIGELAALEKPFSKQNRFGLKFESECLFAKQQITKSDFAVNTASRNQASLRNAILNVAAIGISLNPAQAHAYLVPREGGICLDVSYRGLVKLATDSGAIVMAKAVLVYSGDAFQANGSFELPSHSYDPFDKDRIDAKDPSKGMTGGYCAAKLHDGTWMVEFMSYGEIIAVRDSSKAKNGPWKGEWFGEMAKKTLVKRAAKSWPQSSDRESLQTAIAVLNQSEGLAEAAPKITSEQAQAIKDKSSELSIDLNSWCKSIRIESVEDLEEHRFSGAMEHLGKLGAEDVK